jgi:hypothetical protein
MYYIDTFGLLESVDVRVITIQHEQYGATIHLFIDTGRNRVKVHLYLWHLFMTIT